MSGRQIIRYLTAWLFAGGCVIAFGQAVDVTVSLDQSTLLQGQQTTLRVFARIDPAYEVASDQIFSWYVDVLNGNSNIARTAYTNLAMPYSDNYTNVSSSGQADGAHCRGIHNTFMSAPHAGKLAPIELLSVPVLALQTGQVAFSVQHGTTVTNLAYDFIVAPTNQTGMYTGGDYAAARATLTVMTAAVRATCATATNGFRVSYPVSPSATYVVQFRTNLLTGATWAPLPGAPHNGGSVLDTNKASKARYYRVAITTS